MAKRKRLSPASSQIFGVSEEFSETKPISGEPNSVRRSSAPIADVSGDASLRAALEEVTDELESARKNGRFVIQIPLDAVEASHLVRDRILIDEDDLRSLMDSLLARGQQTPIEVVELTAGRYGLISGWRRLAALRQLFNETGNDRFATVQALVRKPSNAAAAYVAMVEENEIRVGLSFYERARIAVQAVRQGVHENTSVAVAELFSAARAPKRSKILSFVTLVEALDAHLQFPAAVPEKLGLSLANALRSDGEFPRRLTEALRKAAPETPEAERVILERSLAPHANVVSTKPQRATPSGAPTLLENNGPELIPGVTMEHRQGHLLLSGSGVTEDLAVDLRKWIASRNNM